MQQQHGGVSVKEGKILSGSEEAINKDLNRTICRAAHLESNSKFLLFKCLNVPVGVFIFKRVVWSFGDNRRIPVTCFPAWLLMLYQVLKTAWCLPVRAKRAWSHASFVAYLEEEVTQRLSQTTELKLRNIILIFGSVFKKTFTRALSLVGTWESMFTDHCLTQTRRRASNDVRCCAKGHLFFSIKAIFIVLQWSLGVAACHVV